METIGKSRSSHGWLEPEAWSSMVRTKLLTPALGFLEIPRQNWTGIIEATVRASVAELAHMNRIRFPTSSQNSIFDSDDPKLSHASHENLLSVGRKRKTPKDRDDLRARQIRWKQINGDHRLQHGSPGNGDRRPPLPLREANTTWMLCSWGNPLYFCPNLCASVCLHPLYFCPNLCAWMCLCMCV